MEAALTLDLIKKLRLDEKPNGVDEKAWEAFKKNPARKSYILWDSNRASPPGFGVRVAGKKTYVIRRKVRGKSIMPTVGNVADFPDLGLARKRAAELALQMSATGTNPNRAAREAHLIELTVGGAFTRYRHHLT